MGRKAGKVKVEFIENQKSRNLVFKRRKECVVKKAEELSTLCDVKACMILYAPDHDAPTAPVSVWPPNDLSLVGRLVHQFRAKDSKKDGDDEIALSGDDLRKRSQHVRARIGQLLMDDAEQQQDQFRGIIDLDNSSTELMTPRRPLLVMMMDEADCDNNGEHAQLVRDRVDDHQQQQDQFGGLDHSSLSQEDQFGPHDDDDDDEEEEEEEEEEGLKQLSSSFGNNYLHPQQQQQYAMSGPGLYQGEKSSKSMMMMTSDPDEMMMMMDDTITADQSWCSSSGMAGFDEQEQDDVASTTTDYDPLLFQDKPSASADYFHIDDLWV